MRNQVVTIGNNDYRVIGVFIRIKKKKKRQQSQPREFICVVH